MTDQPPVPRAVPVTAALPAVREHPASAPLPRIAWKSCVEAGTSCENPDVGGWHEAGPAAGLLARRWALEVLRVLNERGPTRFNDLRRETGQPANR